MAINQEFEVVKPRPRVSENWTYVPNDHIIAHLNKCPNDIIVSDYNGIECHINRLPDGLYRVRMAGRIFTMNSCQLRQLTMAR